MLFGMLNTRCYRIIERNTVFLLSLYINMLIIGFYTFYLHDELSDSHIEDFYKLFYSWIGKFLNLDISLIFILPFTPVLI